VVSFYVFQYPRSKNTFDPPRPFEGRISRKLIPKPPPQKPGSSCGENTSKQTS
jgi:hypothetical protein